MKKTVSASLAVIILATTFQCFAGVHLTKSDLETIEQSLEKIQSSVQSRTKRQVISDPQPFFPVGVNTVLSVPIPTNIGFFPGASQARVDPCDRDQVQMQDGSCHDILTRGNCAENEEVLLDPETNRGFCAQRLCAPDRIFLHHTQLCHDPTDVSVCPPGRELFYSAYGTPVCSCPDGQIEGDDDLDDDVCEEILATSMQCYAGQDSSSSEEENTYSMTDSSSEVFWFRDFNSPPECLPDPCNGANLRKSPNELPFVPSKTGQCFQIGQTTGVCSYGSYYALALEELRGECTTLEDAGYTILDQKELKRLEEIYGPIVSKNRAPAIGSLTQGHSATGFPSSPISFGPSNQLFPNEQDFSALNNQLFPNAHSSFAQNNQYSLSGHVSPGISSFPSSNITHGVDTNILGGSTSTAVGSAVVKLHPTHESHQTFVPQDKVTGTNQNHVVISQNIFVANNEHLNKNGVGQHFTTISSQGKPHTPIRHEVIIGPGVTGTGHTKRPMTGDNSFRDVGSTQSISNVHHILRINTANENAANSPISFVPASHNGKFALPVHTSLTQQNNENQIIPSNLQTNRQSRVLSTNNLSVQRQNIHHSQISTPVNVFHSKTINTDEPLLITGPRGAVIGKNFKDVEPHLRHQQSSQITHSPINQTAGRRRPSSIIRENIRTDSRNNQQSQSQTFVQPAEKILVTPRVSQIQKTQQDVHSQHNFGSFQNAQGHNNQREICTFVHSNNGGPGRKVCSSANHGQFGSSGIIGPTPFNSVEVFGGQQFFNSPEVFGGHFQPIQTSEMHRGYGYNLGKSIGFKNPPQPGVLKHHYTELPNGRRITHVDNLLRQQRNTNVTEETLSNIEHDRLRHRMPSQSSAPHSRRKRSPLPYASPSNVFEPKLLKCRPGAVRDINAKCRTTVLPPRVPKSRGTRAAPPVPPTPSCSQGMAFNIRRMCVPATSAQNSLIAFNLG